MKTLIFDVMLDGRFVKTFKYKYNPAFVLEENELRDFVLSKMPTLKEKKFQILF